MSGKRTSLHPLEKVSKRVQAAKQKYGMLQTTSIVGKINNMSDTSHLTVQNIAGTAGPFNAIPYYPMAYDLWTGATAASSPKNDPYENAVAKVKPRITRMKIFRLDYSGNTMEENGSKSFEMFQTERKDRLIISTTPFIRPTDPHTTLVLVTYSEEI